MYESWLEAHKVAVIGAGTMGSGIAAHLANLGFEVFLFDLTKEVARNGLERAQKIKPPHFYDQESVSRVQLASIADDPRIIGQVDWVCEAVVENAEVKRDLYALIEPILSEDSMISTNTSGLEVSRLAEGRSEAFKHRFLGTHFFNPPRYLKLLELIPTSWTHPTVVAVMTRFLEERVGRRVVVAKDTPGFIANRYGMWCLFQGIHTAERLRLTVEQVDAITGPFLGRPRTATFRLADLIGLDIMADVASNIRERCESDPRVKVLELPKSVAQLLSGGRIGAKVGRGYYERTGKDFVVYDFADGGYRPQQDPDLRTLGELGKLRFGERMRAALSTRDEVGEYVRAHLPAILEYAALIGPEVSNSAEDFDRVMKWGFGWEMGPFEMIDVIGYDLLKTYWDSHPLEAKAPFYPPGEILDFRTMKHVPAVQDSAFATVEDFPVVHGGSEWVLRDDGRDGFIFQWRTKMGVLTPVVVKGLIEHLRTHPTKRITLANSGPNFSAGYDLSFFLQAAESGSFNEVEQALIDLQTCGDLLRGTPSAAAIFGHTLGGGLEIAMHCRKIMANPEANVGLVEPRVGLIPAGGGTALMRHRSQGNLHTLAETAFLVGTGMSVQACTAKKSLFLRDFDRLAVNPDRLLFDTLEVEREPLPKPVWLPAPGPARGMIESLLEKAKAEGVIGEYGLSVAEEVKQIFVRSTSYDNALELEREAFLRLLGKTMTVMRIKHMLETGKPLNN